MALSAKAILQQFETAETNRSNWEGIWDQVARLVIPSRNFRGKRTPGTQNNDAIYDATAPLALETLASGMHGLLVNPSIRWFKLGIIDDVLEKQRIVREYLYDATTVMLRIFAHPDFGFDTQSHEMFTELGSFGAAVLILTERAAKINFRAIPLQEAYLVENNEGQIDTVFRKYTFTPLQAFKEFGDKLSVDTLKMVEKGDNETKLDFIHAVFPNEDIEFGRMDAVGKKFASVYIELKAKKIVRIGGFDQFPYITPRWKKGPGEVYGRSPAIDSLPEIGMINAMRRTMIMAAEKELAPPILVDINSIEGPIRVAPNSIIHVRQGARRPEPLDSGNKTAITTQLIDQSREQIKEAFFNNVLGPIPENDRMTATEVIERIRQKMIIMSPVVARISSEVFDKLIPNAFTILRNIGLIPPPPQELAGNPMKVHYTSPLARGQKAAEAATIQQLMEFAAPLITADPRLLDIINGDEAIRRGGLAFDVPVNVLRTEAEVAQIRQDRDRIELAATTAAIAKDGAAAAKDAASAVSEVANV